jgi:predicted phosphodiesterase
MRLALISDIHANLPALRATLTQLDGLGYDDILCLGDLVGYGCQPRECLDLIAGRGIVSLLGNHDAGVAGTLTLNHFREPNRSVIRRTAEMLTDEQIAYLKGLPLTADGFDGLWTAAHASPVNPAAWAYLDTARRCREVLDRVPETFVFAGHTHVPGVVANEIGVFGIRPGHRYVINPGSVGQPRDGDRRASAGIFDFEAYTWIPVRAEYDTAAALEGCGDLGLTRETARKLLYG